MGKNKGQKNKAKKDKPFTVINTKKTKTKADVKNLKNVSQWLCFFGTKTANAAVMPETPAYAVLMTGDG